MLGFPENPDLECLVCEKIIRDIEMRNNALRFTLNKSVNSQKST